MIEVSASIPAWVGQLIDCPRCSRRLQLEQGDERDPAIDLRVLAVHGSTMYSITCTCKHRIVFYADVLTKFARLARR